MRTEDEIFLTILFFCQTPSVSSEELILPRLGLCYLSRLRCHGHNIILFSYLCRIIRKDNSSCSACGLHMQDPTHLLLNCPMHLSLSGTPSLALLLLFLIFCPDLEAWPDYWVSAKFIGVLITRKGSHSTTSTTTGKIFKFLFVCHKNSDLCINFELIKLLKQSALLKIYWSLYRSLWTFSESQRSLMLPSFALRLHQNAQDRKYFSVTNFFEVCGKQQAKASKNIEFVFTQVNLKNCLENISNFYIYLNNKSNFSWAIVAERFDARALLFIWN